MAFQAALVTERRSDPAHLTDLSPLVAALQAAARQAHIPWQASLAKLKCGLVLEPAIPLDGAPFGVRLPLSILTPGIPLRGVLVQGSRITAVQVPSIANTPAEPAWSGSDPPNLG